MKVLIGTDIEGVAGVVSFSTQTKADTKYYEEAKKLLTAEVNAAVEGLLEAGADDILVVDGHGPGAIHFESLHPEAKLLHGRPCAPIEIRREVYASYDVAVMIGQHAMAGAQCGNLNHTQSSDSIDYVKLNGEKVGEIAQFALHIGALGLPFIFLSGDDVACREAEELIDGLATVAVKQGLSRNSAISISAQAAAQKIRTGISAALKKHIESPSKPFVMDGPFTLEKRFFHTDTVDAICADPRYTRIDSQTYQISSDNVIDIIYC